MDSRLVKIGLGDRAGTRVGPRGCGYPRAEHFEKISRAGPRAGVRGRRGRPRFQGVRILELCIFRIFSEFSGFTGEKFSSALDIFFEN